jgi:dolichol-phosphate mannosyltransferase
LSYYSGDRIVSVFDTFKKALDYEKIPFEFIIIDDHSEDESFKIAKDLAASENSVSAYRLIKNYTSPYGHFAGLTKSKGACAVAITDDEQIPVELVIRFYRQWQLGNKVVIGFRDSRHDGYLTDISANLYYYLMNLLSEVKFPKGGTDAILIDRSIVDILNNQISQNNTSPIIEVLKLGFDSVYLPYDRPKSKNKSRWTLKKKLKFASDSFFSSSSLPIKIITWFGFIIFDLALLLGFILFISKLLLPSFRSSYPSWLPMFTFFCFFNGLVIFAIGIAGQYIWRILEDVRGKRPFIIEENSPKDEHHL